jgi:hypothetical protein
MGSQSPPCLATFLTWECSVGLTRFVWQVLLRADTAYGVRYMIDEGLCALDRSRTTLRTHAPPGRPLQATVPPTHARTKSKDVTLRERACLLSVRARPPPPSLGRASVAGAGGQWPAAAACMCTFCRCHEVRRARASHLAGSARELAVARGCSRALRLELVEPNRRRRRRRRRRVEGDARAAALDKLGAVGRPSGRPVAATPDAADDEEGGEDEDDEVPGRGREGEVARWRKRGIEA